MLTIKTRKILNIATILTCVISLMIQPLMGSAQPITSANVKQRHNFAEQGIAFLESSSEAIRLSAELLPTMESLSNSPLDAISINSILQTREKFKELANLGAKAIGSIDEIILEMEAFGGDSPEGVNVVQEANDGISEELSQSLVSDLELPGSYVENIDLQFKNILGDRLQIVEEGLPPDVADMLYALGLSQVEIDEVANSIATRGLTDTSLSTRLDQLRASQDEWGNLRTRALGTYVHLLGLEIAVRQLQGVPSRTLTDQELAEIAEDELRLLIHIAHLNALWEDDPNLKKGEGDWWFIERYATRSAERLEQVILDSQNLALSTDLFILLYLGYVARSAQAGDPFYAKSELAWPTAFLEFRLGDSSFVTREIECTHGLVKVVARLLPDLPLREHFQWPVPQGEKDLAISQLRNNLHSPITFSPKLGIDGAEDIDPTNNALGVIFLVGLNLKDQIKWDVVSGLLSASLLSQDLVHALTVILGFADPENPWEVVALVVVSFLPILDFVNDFVTVIVNEDMYVKAAATFGLTLTLTEGAFILYLGLDALLVGPSIAIADGFVTGIRGAYALTADSTFKAVVNTLQPDEALELVADHVGTTIKFMGDEGITVGSDAVGIVKSVFEGDVENWNNFVVYIRKVGGRTPSYIVENGYDEGGRAVGAMFRQADEFLDLTESQYDAVRRISLDFFNTTNIRLSNNATAGLGVIVRDIGGEAATTFVNTLRSSPDFRDALLEPLLEVLGVRGRDINWVYDGLEGVVDIVKRWDDLGPVKVYRLIEYINDPIRALQTFRALRGMTIPWSDQGMEGVAVLLRANDNVAAKAINMMEGESRLGRAYLADKLFSLIRQGDVPLGGTDEWTTFLRNIAGDPSGKLPTQLWGYSNVLFFIDETIKYNNLARIEIPVTGPDFVRIYDLQETSTSYYYECKNVSDFREPSAEQMYQDLVIFGPSGRINEIRWRFRGTVGTTDGPPSKEKIYSYMVNYINKQNIPDPIKKDLIKYLIQLDIGYTGGTRPYPVILP